jgi:small conductance mechanosensitive channel
MLHDSVQQPIRPSYAFDLSWGFPGSALLMSSVLIIAAELCGIALLYGILYALAQLLLRAIPAAYADQRRAAAASFRTVLIVSFTALGALAIAGNVYLLVRGIDPAAQTSRFIRSIPTNTWNAIGIGLAKLALAAAGLLAAARLVRRVLGGLEKALTRSEAVNDIGRRIIGVLFGSIERSLVNLGWIGFAVYASVVLLAPSGATRLLVLVARIYLVLATGLVAIRSTPLIVSAFDAMARRYAGASGWLPHYDRLRLLLPTLRVCLDYALCIGTAWLALFQLPALQRLAAWGPRLIEAVGLFFAGRVLIELGHLEIEHRMLAPEGLEEPERRRRATMVPLVRSAFAYSVYFGVAALVLGALGFNPMPFLAGAGLLGVVVGFGAQSLINDVVSGFFILFENIYLIGDMVEADGARGVVESIEFRTTKIRDAEGRVHIIRNGDMKPVINYSKDYTIAVVTMEVPYDADLPAVFAKLRHAGARLRSESRDVMEDTRIDGITAFGASSMTVRTSTRVLPGRHESVAAALRLLIKETPSRPASVSYGSRLVVAEREQLDVERI